MLRKILRSEVLPPQQAVAAFGFATAFAVFVGWILAATIFTVAIDVPHVEVAASYEEPGLSPYAVTIIDNLQVTTQIQMNTTTGPKIKTTTSDPNGVTTEPAGTLYIRTDSPNVTLYQNTDGGTAWSSGSSGSKIGEQIFTGSGTYTPTTGTRSVLITMVAGGGGGGGAALGANSATGGGGSSGTYFRKWISPGAAITGGAATVGAAGAAGANTGGAGGNGGDTSIVIQGTTYTAKGGLGGAGTASLAPPQNAAGGGRQGGSSVGDIVYQQAGTNGWTITGLVYTGTGGSTALGAGGVGSGLPAPTPGQNGNGKGAGGGGAGTSGATAETGGAGAIGIIIVEEFR